MNELPPIQYTQAAGDVDIAYRVVGSGPFDIVWVPGLIGNLEIDWEDRMLGSLYRRLAAFSRLITFDKRGMGLSDRAVGAPTLEERMDDVRAVMDAVGSERAAIIGISEGGPMSMLFAATYPERTIALVLVGTLARCTRGPDYPAGNEDAIAALYRCLDDGWGTGASAEVFAQSLAAIPAARKEIGRMERSSGSPRTIRAVLDGVAHSDVRPAARTISVPTLVIHTRDDLTVPIDNGRWLAENIPGAQFFEMDGEHVVFDRRVFAEEVEAFLTGGRSVAPVDRVLSTVLFSDIVGSTEQASSLGDQRWRELLDQHDQLVRREIESFGGRLVKSTGDGVMACFDGPGRGVRCGQRLHQTLAPIGIDVRVGLHTGEIELRGDDIGGIGVHIAARVSGLAETGEVLVSRTVTDLVAGSGLEFDDRGEHDLKGVPGSWQLYAVAD